MLHTFLQDTPNVHLHYEISDELADAQGYSEIELCCHACGLGLKVLFNLPPDKDPVYEEIGDNGIPQLRKIRDEFETKHKECQAADPPLLSSVGLRGVDQFRYLCPPYRKNVETLDVRTDKPEDRLI